MIAPSPTLELAQRVAEAQARGERAFSFSTPTFGEPTDPLILHPGANLGLAPAAGFPDMRALARQHLFGKWNLPGHEIIITTGAKAACLSILKAVTSPGDRVLIVAPAWPSYCDICDIASLGRTLLETRFNDGFAITAEALEAAMEQTGATVILLANPGNPSGRLHGADELALLRHTAEKHNAWIILDESFSNIVFDDRAWSVAVPGLFPRLAVINSFSKNYKFQGLRLGAALLPRAIFASTLGVHQAILSSAPSASQQLVIAHFARRSGSTENYHAQRQCAIAFADKMGWQYNAPEGTFYFFPRLPNAAQFAAEAARRGVYLLGGEAFGPSYAEHVRFCFGKPMEELEAVIDALK